MRFKRLLAFLLHRPLVLIIMPTGNVKICIGEMAQGHILAYPFTFRDLETAICGYKGEIVNRTNGGDICAKQWLPGNQMAQNVFHGYTDNRR